MKLTKRTAFLIGAALLVFSIATFALLMALRPEPPRVERPVVDPLVTTIQPEVRQGALTVYGNGTVRPVREVSLVAEVAGKITWTAPALTIGGFFRQGQLLLRIDSTDYANAVAMAEAEVTQRTYELLLQQQEAELAQAEWQRAQQFTEGAPPPETDMGALVLREPQLKLAHAVLKSAQARLADAQARLGRTRITAPFNGRIRMESVDTGQYVGPGQVLATAYSTDAVEVAVPLVSREAALLTGLWQQEAQGRRARLPATIYADFGGRQHAWPGFVDRTEGTLDPSTRTINVVVRVAQPYRADDRPPLMVGQFTRVALEGRQLDHYLVLPRTALREGNIVWVVEEDRLVFYPVEVIQEMDESVFVQGLADDAHVVLTTLPAVTEGMAVRRAGTDAAPAIPATSGTANPVPSSPSAP